MIVDVAQIDPDGGVAVDVVVVVSGAAVCLRDDDEAQTRLGLVIEFRRLSDADHAGSGVDLEDAVFVAGSESVLNVGRTAGRSADLREEKG